MPDEVYVLMDGPIPISVHEHRQGADEAMAGWSPQAQANLRVECVPYAE